MTTAVTLVAAASAGQIFSEHFRDAEDSRNISNFCGVADLTVSFATTADGHIHASQVRSSLSPGRDGAGDDPAANMTLSSMERPEIVSSRTSMT